MIYDKIKKNITSITCIFLLSIYLISIIYINFSENPNYYNTDMYSDMSYASEVWKQKSIFPEGWVFGNQLYCVATPVIASLFYGLTNNHCIAMGIASTIMGIGVLLSFNWMLKSLLKSSKERIIGILVFMSLPLMCGDPIYKVNGWQLFFTMCSFYSCYAINMFLAFGCYLKSYFTGIRNLVMPLILSCVLSFGTGMQSLRQTVIMVCPLVAVEFLCIIYRILNKKRCIEKSLIVTVCITVSNLFGVLCSRVKNVEQVEIFEKISVANISNIHIRVISSLSNVLSLLNATNKIVLLVIAIIGVFAFFYSMYKLYIVKNHKGMICLALLSISIAAILSIEIFTTMSVRNIYYFMLYPIAALVAAFLYAYGRKVIRLLIIISLVIVVTFNYFDKLSPVIQESGQIDSYEEVVDYLEDNNITTIFSGWNLGEKIVISSKWKINAGFWDSPQTPFVCVNYLCNPDVFNVEASQCAYVFYGEENAGIAIEKANKANVEFTLSKYFPENDIYIFTSATNLMQWFSLDSH